VPQRFGQEAADLAEDALELLAALDREVPGVATLNAECRPPLDVLETRTALEIVLDVPGVKADSIRIAVRRDTLLVVGAKLAPPSEPRVRYHLAERSYGRFARAVRISSSVDALRARATTSGGELRVVLPHVEERRGAMHLIPVDPA